MRASGRPARSSSASRSSSPPRALRFGFDGIGFIVTFCRSPTLARAFRWTLVVLLLGFLGALLAGRASARTVAGFVVCGALWYWLKWRKAMSLDAPVPRKPYTQTGT